VRLVIVASKPTDAVAYGFLPAAGRLGLEVLLLTDQPEATARAVRRARVLDGGRPRIVACDVHDPFALIAAIGGLPAPDAVFSNSDRLQTQTALAAEYFGLPGKDWRASLRARNKPLMRSRLAGTGAEKVTAVELTAGSTIPPELPYPLVLKPAGAFGQLARAGCPAGQAVSTTLALAGGDWLAGLKDSGSAQ
jgi:hypothetical protein